MRRLWILLVLVVVLGAVGLRLGLAAGALGPGFYNDPHPAIVYSGSWTLATSAGFYNNDRYYTTAAAGTSAVFSIWGDGFVWYTSTRSSAYGNNYITIDGVQDTWNNQSGSISPINIEFNNLGWGTHDVIITADTGVVITMDAVHVLPPAEQPTLPPATLIVEVDLSEVTPDPWIETFDMTDSEDNTQAVAFSYSMDAGDVFNGVVSVGTLFVVLSAFLFYMWKSRGDD